MASMVQLMEGSQDDRMRSHEYESVYACITAVQHAQEACLPVDIEVRCSHLMI